MWFKSTSFVSNLFIRIAVGIPLVLIGISFYRDFAPFRASAIDGLAGLEILGSIWSYLLPALFIFAGGMLVVGRYPFVTAWVGGIALASVPIGMGLKNLMTNMPQEEVLNFIFPIFIWMILFHKAVNMPGLEYVEGQQEESEEENGSDKES